MNFNGNKPGPGGFVDMMSLDRFIAYKIKILTKHFCVRLSNEQIDRLKSCKTCSEVDNVARSILNHYFGED